MSKDKLLPGIKCPFSSIVASGCHNNHLGNPLDNPFELPARDMGLVIICIYFQQLPFAKTLLLGQLSHMQQQTNNYPIFLE